MTDYPHRQVAAAITLTEETMKRTLVEAFYGYERIEAPGYRPPREATPEQLERPAGFYWVRDRDHKGEMQAWRVDEWSPASGWSMVGSEETWFVEPDEIGPRVEPPHDPVNG